MFKKAIKIILLHTIIIPNDFKSTLLFYTKITIKLIFKEEIII